MGLMLVGLASRGFGYIHSWTNIYLFLEESGDKIYSIRKSFQDKEVVFEHSGEVSDTIQIFIERYRDVYFNTEKQLNDVFFALLKEIRDTDKQLRQLRERAKILDNARRSR